MFALLYISCVSSHSPSGVIASPSTRCMWVWRCLSLSSRMVTGANLWLRRGVRMTGIQCAPLGSLEWQGLVLLPMLFPWEPFGHKKIWLQKETQIRVCGVWHSLESLGQPNVHLVSVFPCFIWGVQKDTLPACGVIYIHRLSLTLPRYTEKAAYRVHRPVQGLDRNTSEMGTGLYKAGFLGQ